MVGPMESGAVYIAQTDLSTGSRTGSRTESRDGTAPQSGVSTSDGGTPRTSDSQDRGGGTGTASNCTEGSNEDKVHLSQNVDWVRMTVSMLSHQTHKVGSVLYKYTSVHAQCPVWYGFEYSCREMMEDSRV